MTAAIGHSLITSSAARRVIHVRKRIARAGPEDRLIRAALKTEFFLRRELPAVFFHEPEMPTGLPDVVAVYMSKKEQPELTPDRLRLTAAHIRMLHGLHTVSSTTIEELAFRVRMPYRALERLAADLRDADLISLRAGKIAPRKLSRGFAVKHIFAIEAKISNWSKALEQAAGNRWFASHSFILIPPSRSMDQISERARELGVGVLVFDGCEVCEVVAPKVFPIPNSYGSWLFNEWALRKGRPL
jgi:hypothetical protein